MSFHERLKSFRLSLNLTMKDLSKKLNFSESYYSLLESGKRKPSEKFLESLVILSNKDKLFWVYGCCENKKDYELSFTEHVLLKLLKNGILTPEDEHKIFNRDYPEFKAINESLKSLIKLDISLNKK